MFSSFVIATGAGDFSVSDDGIFGWIRSERFFFALYLGIVVGIFGNIMCIATLDVLPGLVVSVAQSLVPPVGTFMAVVEGAERMPDLFTTAGVACMLSGALYIAFASSPTKATDEDASDYV